MKRALFLLLNICLATAVYSTETAIQGTVQGFEGKIIKAIAVEDYITNYRTELSQSKIVDGKFNLRFSQQETQQIFLKIEDKETSLFAESGKVYNLNLKYDEEANLGRAFDKYLDLQFSFPMSGDINLLIKQFNTSYQDFFSKNYKRIVIKAAQKETNEFIDQWETKEGFHQNSFVDNYINYALASLKQTNGTSKQDLFEQYLKGQEILYGNKEYMNFFNQYFQKDFDQLSLTKNGAEVLKAIMLEKSLSKTLALLQKFKNFDDPKLAELYLINGLFAVYHKKTIQQSDNLNFLSLIAKDGRTEANQDIAKHAIEKLKKFSSDKAPNFTLPDEKGEQVSLTSFKGKPIYLGFWADWSIPSLRELRVIQSLEEKYGQKVHFVSINIDDKVDKMKQLKEKNNYDWTFLHYGEDYEIREKYNIKTVPVYFLIDENGKMLKAQAQGPAEIEQTIAKLAK